LSLHPKPWTSEVEAEYHATFTEAIEQWLDAGDGACVLRDHAIARLVANALLHFDGQRYLMDAFVIMPNHVHALFRLVEPFRLESVLKSWKGFTAREINKRLGRRGKLWQDDYWDRLIRNESHWLKCRDYVFDNPPKANLPANEYLLFERLVKERGFSTPRG
jgi:REP element-mobilizing transposase RayT